MITDYPNRQLHSRPVMVAVEFVQPYACYHRGDRASFTEPTARQYIALGVAVDPSLSPSPAPPPRRGPRTSQEVIAAAIARGDWAPAPTPERGDV